jgi:mono/diheme cytochrome c family protein
VKELGSFLGHFHPVLVHLPIGILLLLGLLEAAGLLSRLRPLGWLPALTERQRTLILAVGAAAAVLAAWLGWLLAHGGDYDLALVGSHQTLGIAAASAAVLLLAIHRWRWLYGPLLAASLVLLAVAAHAGAKITHGSDYLTAHMPPSIAGLLGIDIAPPPKPRTISFENAVSYADVVQPILQERCVGCHGAAKSNGGLRVDSWELLAKGGKHGLVLKPGASSPSALVRRIDLPVEEKEHMPPRGKPQLSDDDLTLLEWWVSAGAPRDRRVATLDLPASVQVILEGRLAGGAAEAPPDRAATLAAAALVAGRLGVLIRPLSPDGPWLDVNARAAGKGFGDRELAQLGPIAPAVEWLDLGDTSVTDSGLAALGPMRRLRRLHLDELKVTDGGLARLTQLRQLEYLNLRGTSVTDKGIAQLRALPRLRSLYAWKTAVTPAAVKALGEALIDKRRIARWKQDEADLERMVQEEHFEGNTGEALLHVDVNPLTHSEETKPPDTSKLPP